MDDQTLQAYTTAATGYADEWAAQPAAADMHALLDRFFAPGPTADIGCGAGRDTAWLAAHGFEARGFDACEALLREARARHPGIDFAQAELPALDGVARGAWQNVLCETVIMHLEPTQVGTATRALVSLLRPGGTLYLSWRVTAGASRRDEAGRLYAAFEAQAVRDAIGAGHALLFDREDTSASSGRRVHRLIVRRAG
jgi:2-polyprenyl-3-methyl-5-hydroxy-6-metoxy-1,4-benzoquinol methylase